MPRIVLLVLFTVFFKPAYTQQFYSDHGNPIIDPKVPCDCSKWHSEKKSVDSAVKVLKTVFFIQDGIKYKRVYYVTEIKTTWHDICDDPATCKDATRKRITTENRFWHTDTPDCGELKPGEVCCNNQPVLKELCCDGKVLNPGEVCCKDKEYWWKTLSASAGKDEPWWQYILQTSEKTKNVLKKVPAAITIEGPTISGEYKMRHCCKDGVNEIGNGETEVSAGIAFGIYAKDLPCTSLPWTARFEKDITVMGYTMGLDIRYGLFATIGAEVNGNISYNDNQCIPEQCYSASVGLDIPVKFELKASLKACVKKAAGTSTQCLGTTLQGVQCRNRTLNLCGYCYLHTNQSWWCIPCLDITPAAIGISTKFYGSYGFECNKPAQVRLGIDKVLFSLNISIWGFGFNVAVPITNGMILYP